MNGKSEIKNSFKDFFLSHQLQHIKSSANYSSWYSRYYVLLVCDGTVRFFHCYNLLIMEQLKRKFSNAPFFQQIPTKISLGQRFYDTLISITFFTPFDKNGHHKEKTQRFMDYFTLKMRIL